MLSGLFVLFCACFSGCTVTPSYFFRNYSNQPVVVVVNINYPMSLPQNSVPFKNNLVKINRRTFKNLNDSLPFTRINDSEIAITVPGHATIALPPFYRFSSYVFNIYTTERKPGAGIDTIRFHADGKAVPREKNQFKSTGGPLIQNLLYFDYKK